MADDRNSPWYTPDRTLYKTNDVRKLNPYPTPGRSLPYNGNMNVPYGGIVREDGGIPVGEERPQYRGGGPDSR